MNCRALARLTGHGRDGKQPPGAARNISETRRSGRNPLSMASWPRWKGPPSTFKPRFGGAAHFGGPSSLRFRNDFLFVLIWFARSIQASAIWWRKAVLVLSLMTCARRRHSTALRSRSWDIGCPRTPQYTDQQRLHTLPALAALAERF